MNDISSVTTLHNGVKMPWLGLGVFKVEEGDEVEHAVSKALAHGYRSIDTAAFYNNERGVGRALKAADISRENVFVTTKLWNDRHGYDEALKAFEESRSKLGLETIDLYLIHWPIDGYKESWKAFETLYKDGRVRAIGVSNFKIHHLQDLMADCEIKPMVNQVEFHPYLYQKELLDFCREHHIQLQAWSPLAQGKLLDHPVLKEIGDTYGKTPAQVIIRWDLQHEVVTIPKSVRDRRIRENADVFDFSLSEAEMERINALNKNERVGPDPDEMNRRYKK